MNILISNQQDKKINIKKIRNLTKEILKNLQCSDEVEISILLTDDNFIRALNKKYRKKDKPTDVLSFPQGSWVMGHGSRKNLSILPSHYPLGDVVISIDTTKKQAAAQKISLNDEITRLLIHGILHLLGYEHENGGKKIREMRMEEERLLGLLKM